ncbi:guanylate kinase [Buchnera aphidicola (Kurisakia onigurumii)]|uniref:guanylate kinase n=1 Tax=Buchnera aphidicola TaxID=9 RepID=UPI0031B6821F
MIQLGTFFIISAPSGTGKSSLIRNFLKTKTGKNIRISISHTTRLKRKTEKEGKDYYFINKSEFHNMIKKNIFLEYAIILNQYYGTSKNVIKDFISKGIDIFLDIDWQGAQQIRKNFSQVKSIFMLPPSIEELYIRLKNRGQNSEKEIIQRINMSLLEVSHCHEYDYLIINDDFKKALNELAAIVIAERLSIRNKKKYKRN